MMRRLLRWVLTGLLPVVVLGGTAWVVWTLYLTRPTVVRENVKPPPPIVTTADLAAADHRIRIEAYGTVVPARRVMLRTQVSGRIINQHPALSPGGVLQEGVEVIGIDPADYKLRVKQEEVALASAKASYELEQGQQVVAAKEWALLKDEIEAPQEMEDFALRRPQKRQAQAAVDAAENRLALARLDLERTVVHAPFNALVLDESVEIGQLISPQDEAAELVGTDEFWVRVAVPYDVLGRIAFPQGPGRPGSTAEVFLEEDLEQPRPREAHVLRSLGDLSERGRMARILISIDDPLCLSDDHPENDTPVLLNSYVRVVIDAGVLEGVVEIPRTALRENAQVWLRDAEGRLQIRDVDIHWRQPESVLVPDEFAAGEQLITSRLAVVVPGMETRVGSLPGQSVAARDNTATQPAAAPEPSGLEARRGTGP
jgi:RND family efflux transporter MFP subunit